MGQNWLRGRKVVEQEMTEQMRRSAVSHGDVKQIDRQDRKTICQLKCLWGDGVVVLWLRELATLAGVSS